MLRRIVEFQQLSFGISYNPNPNKEKEHREVARRKIIHFYFMNGEANMQELIDMEMNVMVHAIEMIGSFTGVELGGHALLYQLIRSVPSLFDDVSSNRKKRKLG